MLMSRSLKQDSTEKRATRQKIRNFFGVLQNGCKTDENLGKLSKNAQIPKLRRLAITMSETNSISQWIDDIRDGQSLAAINLWNQYYQRLISLARRKLKNMPRRVTDEEDIALEAFNSFCRGAEQGRFPKLDDRDDLWQVLVMLTARKAANQIKFDLRQKRGAGNVRGESIFIGGQEIDRAGLDQIVGSEPTEHFAEDVAKQCSEFLDQLDDDVLRQVAIAKMEGYTNDEIAEQLGVKTRTIERKLKLIREKIAESEL